MRRSTDRILATHTGSLPRPAPLHDALAKIDRGDDTGLTEETWDQLVASAVKEIVARQVAVGIDIVNDGEMSKVSYATYVTRRMSGFGGTSKPLRVSDAEDFPGWGRPILDGVFDHMLARPACVGDVVYQQRTELHADLENFAAALADTPAEEAFMTAPSPGIVSTFLENKHYPTHEAYLRALADAMKIEYDAIHQAGFILQIDSPDIPAGHLQFPELSPKEWEDTLRLHVEVINDATRDIPADAMRMHLCWGNYEGPHHRDVPLADLLGIVLEARPAGLLIESANPRHAHEWELFRDVTLPDEKVLIPGVIDTTTNYIEHPKLVAQRIVQFAELVGRERVIAGTDCGFATFAALVPVDPEIVFAKLRALKEGADLASDQLW